MAGMYGRLLAVGFMALPAIPAPVDGEFFETRIRPMLVANCHGCHTKQAMGGLRLDSREAALKGGQSGAVIVPGKPEDSLLIQAVKRTHPKIKMPPNAALQPEDVAALEEWIRRGAVFPEAGQTASDRAPFWAFQPLKAPPRPAVNNAAWVKGPIDAFVLSKLEARGLTPVKPAGNRTLLRRASLGITGLPPSPDDYEALASDNSPEAWAKAVDRLLESPHYGEKWARHWLDIARYSDGQLAAGVDTPLPNAWRYRDWVVWAFNSDLPYDHFVRAQLAADLLPESQRGQLLAGLGFQAIGNGANDQLDVTTKAFLGLTVGCAQCHDHKYDPIPTRDYYSLLGVFRSSASHEVPLVDQATVDRYKAQKQKIDDQKEVIAEFIKVQSQQLLDVFARQTARFLVAAWKVQSKLEDAAAIAKKEGLDEQTLKRWVEYLGRPGEKEHPYLKPWYDVVTANPTEEQVRKAAETYQAFVLKLFEDQREVEDKNYVAFGGRKGSKDERTRQYTNIVSLPVLQYYQWRELASEPYRKDSRDLSGGVYHYGAKDIDRFVGGVWKTHLDSLRADLKSMEAELPEMYPFLHSLKEGKLADSKIAIRGDNKNLGDVAPRRFLTCLARESDGAYQNGSGRLQLAEDIVASPITARVIVNRVWQHHFGNGLVRTPSNFGQNGERPTHPELLEYLAARLAENRWSLKALHREILTTSTYGLSSAGDAGNYAADPENKLLWRANLRHRLELESLRDSILAVSGKLDRKAGGPATPISDTNYRRSVYLTVSRTRLDGTMALFDFPDPNATADERPVTAGPLQGLYFLNSQFVASQADALDERLKNEVGEQPDARIRRAYALLFGRTPDQQELKLGLEYVAAGGKAWPRYLQVLLGSGEFTSVN
jgi:mono/diheme cytochrome c family protein